MTPEIKRAYDRLRAKGWTAQYALRAARVNAAWGEAEARGYVQMVSEPDYMPLEDPDWSDLSPSKAARYAKEWREHVQRNGIWMYAAQYRTDLESDPGNWRSWETADSIGGCVSPLDKSGYDVDLKESCLKALDKALNRAAVDYAEARVTYAECVQCCRYRSAHRCETEVGSM